LPGNQETHLQDMNRNGEESRFNLVRHTITEKYADPSSYDSLFNENKL
jgi:hypothetical protein